jgi:hypothetical protein
VKALRTVRRGADAKVLTQATRWQPTQLYRLITTEYVARGLSTVETITPVYAPSSENDTGLYIQQVRQSMLVFRQAQSSMK